MSAEVTGGSEWIRRRDGVRVRVAYVTPERETFTRLVQWTRIAGKRTHWRDFRTFLAEHDPAPPRDLAEHVAHDDVESGHGDQGAIAIASGEGQS